MKLRRLTAKNIHGSMSFDIAFNEDVTFLIGLNGSGKTTILRLINAMLGPNVAELLELRVERAELVFSQDEKLVTVVVEGSSDAIYLSTSEETGRLKIPMFREVQGRARAQVLQQHLARDTDNAVWRRLLKNSKPMYLGLERRQSLPQETQHASNQLELALFPRGEGLPSSLHEVSDLVRESVMKVVAEQNKIDQRLRDQILVESFAYQEVDIKRLASKLPTLTEVKQFRQKQQDLERAAASFGLGGDVILERMRSFFEKLEDMVRAAESSPRPSIGKDGPPQWLIEWMFNRSTIDRIMGLMNLMEAASRDRDIAAEPIERFKRIVNEFLTQAGKSVSIDERGTFEITVLRSGRRLKNLRALSSGERQIVVMLAHLSLDRRRDRTVFMVDEPELSLHIAWQEKFVNAVREANPLTQMILATHSPAIVLDRDDSCVDVVST